MRPRLRRTPVQQVMVPAGDGLDDTIWATLSHFIATVGRGDAAAARSAIPRLERDLPSDGQAASYVWYALRYRAIEILERRPTPEDLHDLAISTWPRFGQIVQGDERLVEDILRSVFKHAPLQNEITGAKLIVLGSAELGILLNDPSADLDRIRPHLAEWWRQNLAHFRRQGIVGANGS